MRDRSGTEKEQTTLLGHKRRYLQGAPTTHACEQLELVTAHAVALKAGLKQKEKTIQLWTLTGKSTVIQ